MSKSNSNYKVYIRLRPIEIPSTILDYTLGEKSLSIQSIQSTKEEPIEKLSFNFSNIFPSSVNQETIYKEISENCVNFLFEGQNALILSYGQTTSGKTYTIFGEDEKFSPNGYFSMDTVDRKGLVSRTVESLIKKGKEVENTKAFVISCSMFEVYLDQVRDLGKAYSDKNTKSKVILNSG